MAIRLPSMAYGDGIQKYRQSGFGGYNHTYAAQDGELWDMENMSSDLYPLLSPRKGRYILRTLTKPNGLYAKDGLFWVDGTKLYCDGTLIGTVADSKKQFVGMGAYIIIHPDMVYYNRLTGEFGTMAKSWSGSGKLQDGTYAGEAAKANTIYASGAAWSGRFRAGDAVTISGCAAHPENNKTVIIREIEGDYLRFYENTFVIGNGGDTEKLTITRQIPEMDYICENENRLWGCKGDTIYCSKLGDPMNFNVFDGISTDSYAVDVGSAGDFTACFSYKGYPCFFKEEKIYKVYGDRPSNFQAMGSASLGVEQGSHRSLAVAGETMFYLSRTGVVAYEGGIPQNIAAPFGLDRYKNAVAGTDGTKYFVSMEGQNGVYRLFVYDTRCRLWHVEDELQAVGFGWNEELYCLDSAGRILLLGNIREAPAGATAEQPVESMAEFGDFVENDPNRKGTGKLQVRLELEEGARVSFYIQFDSDGVWKKVEEITTPGKKSYYLPIVPRRSDHFRIRIEGRGMWRLYSLVRENYSGSEQ